MLEASSTFLDKGGPSFFIVKVMPGENLIAVFIALEQQEAVDGDIDPTPHKV